MLPGLQIKITEYEKQRLIQLYPDLIYIDFLDLSFNNYIDIATNTFNDLPRLNILNLRNNQIKNYNLEHLIIYQD